MDKETIRKNIDLKKDTVRKLKVKAAKKDTNVKNYIEQLVEQDVKKS